MDKRPFVVSDLDRREAAATIQVLKYEVHGWAEFNWRLFNERQLQPDF